GGFSSFPERLYVSLVLSGLKGVRDLRVEWLVVMMNCGAEAQPILTNLQKLRRETISDWG
ncbi:MAG: hypothetical protein QXN79_06640, partial [Zestosphaera sp.]